jgi:hypothetical protein
VHRFSVTQLINFQRCPRQYYFDRVLHSPAPDHLEVWNDAEAPEPPANLTATLKGAVIHRFCEIYLAGDDPDMRLQESFDYVMQQRHAELADRILGIKRDDALKDLSPLAENYLASGVFERVEIARRSSDAAAVALANTVDVSDNSLLGPQASRPHFPHHDGGLWSELSFRLRRPAGILTGTIDKLLISKTLSPAGTDIYDIEIIDFKTNRFRASRSAASASPELVTHDLDETAANKEAARAPTLSADPSGTAKQASFSFDSPAVASGLAREIVTPPTLEEEVQVAATDYQLQMQAYALAVRELLPFLTPENARVKITLHFLDPNVEAHLSDDLLRPEACAQAIDDAMRELSSALAPEHFPVRPAGHCRMCNFLDICAPGREFVRGNAGEQPRIRR